MKKVLHWLLVSCIVLIGMPYLTAQETQETTIEEVEEQTASTDAASDQEDSTIEETEVSEIEEELLADDAPDESTDDIDTQYEAVDETSEEAEISDESSSVDDTAESSYEQAEPDIDSPKWEGGEQEEVTEEAPELGPDEIMGIDTVDLEDPQGNWLYKRVWWERTEAKFEKIRELVNKILESRTNFFSKRAELDKKVFDPFYIKIGISQGELQESLAELISKLSKDIQEKKGESYLEKAEADKNSLETVQKEIQSVIKQDGEIDDAINMFAEQVAKVRNLEQEAWQDFKSIARVLDDKKARELFYKVDSALRNIKEQQSYIADTFSVSFDDLIGKAKDQIKRVEDSVSALKARNIDLKNRTLSALSKIQEEDMDDEDEEEEEPRGMFRRFIIDPITMILKGVRDLVTWPFKKIIGIFGIGRAVEAEEEDEDVEILSESEGDEIVEDISEEPADDIEVLEVEEVMEPAADETILQEEEAPELEEADAVEEPEEVDLSEELIDEAEEEAGIEVIGSEEEIEEAAE